MERKLKIIVLSDVHLGTFGCHADELLNYLQSVDPEILILNGDFIDGWQFKRSFFPVKHIQILYEIMKKAMGGTKVYYLAGNHDEFIRKFIPFFSGNIYFRDQLELVLNGERHLFFHGDAFDFTIRLSPFLAKLGGLGYDTLIKINTMINKFRNRFGFERISFAHSVKSKIKKAINFIKDFEEQAIRYGMSKNADYVICGHIHMPKIRSVESGNKTITYLNSGDWVENFTALEFKENSWSIYQYDELEYQYLNKYLIYKEKPAKVFGDLIFTT